MLYQIAGIQPAQNEKQTNGKICLIRPPYFTPWAPPLGISLLKTFAESEGYSVQCFDFNVEPSMWGLHHEYFKALQLSNPESIPEGHTRLWCLMNAHMLAFMNGAGGNAYKVVRQIAPLYGMHCTEILLMRLQRIVEEQFARLTEMLSSLDLSEVSFFGTTTYTTSLAASLFMHRYVKTHFPKTRTVMGGGVFSDDLAFGSDNLQTLINEFPFVDHAVLGEGELLFMALLKGQTQSRIVSMRDLGKNGLSIQSVPMPTFDGLDLDPYFHLTIEGARSCPFQCSFCSETVQWGDYRKKAKELLADQIIALSHRYSKKHFFMADSLMNPYIEGFSAELLKRNAGILYDGYMRADPLPTDAHRVERWARSGCFRVRLGVETASAHVLELMDKRTRPEIIAQALRSLAEGGVRTTTYWITGFPGEKEEDFNETLEFVRENKDYIYELEAHPFWYYPYGQVSSRLYKAMPAYSEEVTEMIRFQEWEVDNCNPPRTERFRRLRELSTQARQLGIPNIYSMSERYEAEERWISLHPRAIEVY